MIFPASLGLRIAGVLVVVCLGFIVFGTFQAPRVQTIQRGFRGTGMDLIYNKAELIAQRDNNGLPEAIDPVDAAGQKSSTVYQNVQVLGDVDVAEFGRLMQSFAAWVAPQQGCAYCHGNEGNFASDDLYTKRVARRMLQMTRHINADWTNHVQKTGVTCYTCHRGQPVPSYIWFNDPGPASGMAVASKAAGFSSLVTDPYTPYLDEAQNIRVASTTALPSGDLSSIKQTEGTYSLMMHMANSLGVNCTFCHNTRAFSDWSQSTPQRVSAWYGIRMVRDQNDNYLQSLAAKGRRASAIGRQGTGQRGKGQDRTQGGVRGTNRPRLLDPPLRRGGGWLSRSGGRVGRRFQNTEPVRQRSLVMEQAEATVGDGLVVDLVAGHGVVTLCDNPVDEFKRSARDQAARAEREKPSEVRLRPVIAHLRQENEVEVALGQFAGHRHPAEVDVALVEAAPTRLL